MLRETPYDRHQRSVLSQGVHSDGVVVLCDMASAPCELQTADYARVCGATEGAFRFGFAQH
jgi:hypothetical protein